jgi:hypothetical protein
MRSIADQQAPQHLCSGTSFFRQQRRAATMSAGLLDRASCSAPLQSRRPCIPHRSSSRPGAPSLSAPRCSLLHTAAAQAALPCFPRPALTRRFSSGSLVKCNSSAASSEGRRPMPRLVLSESRPAGRAGPAPRHRLRHRLLSLSPGSAGADGTGWLPLAWHAGDAADKGGVGETLLLGVLFAAWYGANIVFNMWVAARRWPRPGCSAAASC